jgi:SAM-dependent methyltransferase
MKNKKRSEILLPGGSKQFEQLRKIAPKKFDKILVMGEASEPLAIKLSEVFSAQTELIVEDYEALLNAKLLLEESDINPKIMEFERTDYANETFDLVYAQAALTRDSRKKIIREVKRILKPNGLLSVGEIVIVNDNVPRMISDLLDWAGLIPLKESEIKKYYSERGFEILTARKFENALKNYYEKILRLFEQRKELLSEEEKSYYKKLIHRISHEANVFMKFGGEKYLAFYSFVAKRN